MKKNAIRSRIARFNKSSEQVINYGFEYIEDGVIEFENGRITLVSSSEALSAQGYNFDHCEHLPDKLILAGFIDAHVHAPQLDVVGAYGEQLLDWLHKYTFPEESKFINEEFSFKKTQRFVDTLLSHGTTTAMVYTTSFSHSTEHLFSIAYEKQMRMLAGKVMMDRNAPDLILDTAQSAYSDCKKLISRWHEKGRLGYAVTPRFAGTSTREQLQLAGKLLAEYPNLWMQTHLSENQAEIEWTKTLFPEAADYLDTYERHGLLNERSMFGHCIYLSDSEVERISKSGASVAFCPSSNLFLGSGLLDLPRLKSKDIAIAACSDIGGGTSLSAFETMGDAYKVCQLQGYSLSAIEAFYLCSLGAAQSLHLDHSIGCIDKGYDADFVVINPQLHPFIKERIQNCTSIDEELFVYMTCGDDRLIDRTYVNGNLLYQQATSLEKS